MHRAEHHRKALAGSVASDRPLRASVSLVSCSKGISQSPEQFPEGQSEAPKAEQLPAQLAPSPQVASSIVLFERQQLTVTDSLTKVKTLSKKSTEGEPKHGAVSVGSPSQAAAEGALLQLRNLNFLPLNQVGSHSDHLPHSAHATVVSPDAAVVAAAVVPVISSNIVGIWVIRVSTWVISVFTEV